MRLATIKTIKKRADFLLAAGKGRKFVTHHFIVQLNRRNPDHPAGQDARFGFTVTKKMGNAVVRNRIKRRLRESVRAQAATALPGHDYVIISRASALECPYAELVRDMEFAFSRIAAKKDDK